jgi:hypothetical protein
MKQSRAIRILAFVALVPTLPACFPWQPGSGASTPAAASVQARATNGSGATYQVLTTHNLGNRAVVFGVDNSGTSPVGKAAAGAGCIDITIDQGAGWNSWNSDCGEFDAPITAPTLACGLIVSGSDPFGKSTIVAGLVLTTTVAAVELTFASGQIITDSTADGAFAVLRPAVDQPTTMRLFDKNNSAIYTDTLLAAQLPPISQSGSSYTTLTAPIACVP